MNALRLRRGLILPVVLFVLVLVGLLGAMFSFRVNADLASTRAVAVQMQTRLAAQAGVERIKLLLRTDRFNPDRWYHNPEELHRVIVWAHDTDPTLWGTHEEFSSDEQAMAYRFSIVADDPTDDEKYIRIGITDEASKLNLNTATEEQLLTLVGGVVGADVEIDPQEIVDAILDWRDTDSVPRAEGGDTEIDYYRTLPKPYRVKNGYFDTVEELLLVKGVTGQVLYGEDFDRNGLLTDNEDDGGKTFPPDNQDGILNRGLYPYLTVISYENNVNNENRPRGYLFAKEEVLRRELAFAFGDDNPAVIDFIVAATRSSGKNKSQAGAGGAGKSGQPPGGKEEENNKDTKTGEEGEGSGEGGEDEEADKDETGNELEDDSSGQSDVDKTGGGGEASPPIRSPASLLLNRSSEGKAQPSPLTVDDLPILMDRFTTLDPKQKEVYGLINVNTAPRQVLDCLTGLSEEQVSRILEVRGTLSVEEKATTAWLVISEVLDLSAYEQIEPLITARGQQFMVESLGYADHIGTVTRLQVIVDMVGPIAQTLYYRDLTKLGGHYPIREEQLEAVRVR